jgi:hypothetical protein
MWRLTVLGGSARKVGRILGRDHHTVRRHLSQDSGEDLAMSLALAGRSSQAREIAYRLGDFEFVCEVEITIEAVRSWRLENVVEFGQLVLGELDSADTF